MGAEIFGVEIKLTKGTESATIKYATKVSIDEGIDTKEYNTFDGGLCVPDGHSASTIKVSGVYYPDTLDDAEALARLLSYPRIDSITIGGYSYTALDDTKYERSITGTGVTVAGNSSDWGADDGMSQDLEFKVNVLEKSNTLYQGTD